MNATVQATDRHATKQPHSKKVVDKEDKLIGLDEEGRKKKKSTKQKKNKSKKKEPSDNNSNSTPPHEREPGSSSSDKVVIKEVGNSKTKESKDYKHEAHEHSTPKSRIKEKFKLFYENTNDITADSILVGEGSSPTNTPKHRRQKLDKNNIMSPTTNNTPKSRKQKLDSKGLVSPSKEKKSAGPFGWIRQFAATDKKKELPESRPPMSRPASERHLRHHRTENRRRPSLNHYSSSHHERLPSSSRHSSDHDRHHKPSRKSHDSEPHRHNDLLPNRSNHKEHHYESDRRQHHRRSSSARQIYESPKSPRDDRHESSSRKSHERRHSLGTPRNQHYDHYRASPTREKHSGGNSRRLNGKEKTKLPDLPPVYQEKEPPKPSPRPPEKEKVDPPRVREILIGSSHESKTGSDPPGTKAKKHKK